MTLDDFKTRFQGITSHTQITIECEHCGEPQKTPKTRAQETIKSKGRYLCRSCGLIESHAANPHTDETREKKRVGRLGKTHSDDTKVRMSESRKKMYATEQGAALKKRQSEITARQHATCSPEGFRRRGIFKSKLNGRPMPYGSSYELRAMVLLEDDETVEKYESQVHFQQDDRHRSLDLLIHYKSGRKLAVEIKPAARVTQEKAVLQIQDNVAHAAAKGYDFEVWTEYELGFKNPYEATCWADAYITQMGDVDFIAARAQAGREKAMRHYYAKLNDKIEVYCEYCKDYHEIREKGYQSNINKNGRYICHKENADRPKGMRESKENPHAADGKKQCLGPCGQVLLFDEFGIDKGKADGRASRCKKCRSEKSLDRYYKKTNDN